MTAPEPAARTVYRDWLLDRMARDPRAVCLDTDTGLFSCTDFGPAAPRYLDLGIAEQCLMGVAAGLAASGWTPYANTMAGFAASRALEAVKLDIARNALPVRIVATHAGVSAGHFGPTHHALEDLAVMRTLPGLTVIVPSGTRSLLALLDQSARLPGPVYLRLGRKPDPAWPGDEAPAELGRLRSLRPGGEILVVATGPLPVRYSCQAAAELSRGGPSVGVLEAHTLKPFDTPALLDRARAARLVVTVEEHWRTGGLGSAVAEALSERCPRRLLRIGLPDSFAETVGTQEELLAEHGLSAEGIRATIMRAFQALPESGRPAASPIEEEQ